MGKMYTCDKHSYGGNMPCPICQPWNPNATYEDLKYKKALEEIASHDCLCPTYCGISPDCLCVVCTAKGALGILKSSSALEKERDNLLDILVCVTHHPGALEEYKPRWEPIVKAELIRLARISLEP